MTLDVRDSISPYIKELSKISEGIGLQTLNKMGAGVNKEIEKASSNLGRVKTHQRFKRGHRLLTSSRYGRSKQLYSRYSHKTDERLPNLGKFSTFRLYPLTGKLVVGFINTRSFNAPMFSGGYYTGTTHVKGKKPKQIAQLIEGGGRLYLTDKQKRFFKRSGWGAAAKRGYVDRKAHRFFNKAKFIGKVENVAQKEFNKALAQFNAKTA